MNKIIRKEQFSEKVFLFEIEAPLIAKSRKAGNFVIVRVDKRGERMPLTIAGADIEKGTITLVVQMVGLSSKKLCALNEGEYVADVVGPLGNPTHIENFGTVVCAGGGLGVAPMLPIIQALKAAGNRVLLLNEHLNADGHDTFLAVRSVVGHDDDLVGRLAHLVLKNDEILRPSGHHAQYAVAGFLQRLDDRQHRCNTQTAAGADHRTVILDTGRIAQRTNDVGHEVTLAEGTQFLA